MATRILLLLLFIMLSACESDNEHFCSKYEYVYKQLNDPELPTYGEMKEQLEHEHLLPEQAPPRCGRI